MTDRSESNLTEIVNSVVQQVYRSQPHAQGMPARWEDLPKNVQMNIKQGFLPVILTTLDVVDNEINTAAEFGHAFMAKVEYADGGTTWHGPLPTEEAAWRWLNARLELDYEDVAEGYEGEVVPLNLVAEDDSLPEAHQKVLDECLAEAWRNVEQQDAMTEADVAADIAQQLVRVYGVVTYPKES